MKKELNDKIRQFGAKSILFNTESLFKALKGIHKRRDIEDIHDIRVASRRIRAHLAVFATYFPDKKTEKWLKVIRSITKAYGSTRDLDVQINFLKGFYEGINDNTIRSGIRRILLRLKQKRKKLQEKVQIKADEIKNSPVLEEMVTSLKPLAEPSPDQEKFSQPLFQLAFDTIHSRLDEFLFYEVFLFHPEKVKELHLMRIAAKNLRYSLEIFTPLYFGKIEPFLEVTRNTQQTLGDIRDCDIWIQTLPNFIKKERQFTIDYYGYARPFNRLLPGFQFLKQSQKKQRNNLYEDFINQWRKWRKQETWLNLRELILESTLQTALNTSNTIEKKLKNSQETKQKSNTHQAT
ncbi:MAG TPA: CHAD domain-containing protein [Anaerolineae bacterium]|nr:CHAD domain-containing protein [Anaerolineae bacterium]